MKRKKSTSRTSLSRFKDYCRLEDAAKVLAAELEEEITIKDLYEYALHGSLKLSVMLGFQLAERDVKEPVPHEDYLRLDGMYHIDSKCTGFRLLLIYESIGFEHPLADLNLWVVRDVDDENVAYRLCRYAEDDGLEWDEEPELSEFFVRRCDLYAFICKAKGIGEEVAQGRELPVHPRQKNSYVKLLSMFLVDGGLDLPEGPYQAAAVLQAMLQQRGDHLSENTLAKIIEEVRETS
ncbi:hypothetical protein [Halomonas sp. M4R1S46]|uniref:hypothetical protein n=1 Tax=Halomonas sp. M4R1S46 TaxID=2982692 RepID=UPI0021E4E088|nr:hypothetical protein [Halomonas sp. M4R1S46]UYG08052.1 hypothetical protein OCT48_01500 [Halomonas sp. M4R1S46]